MIADVFKIRSNRLSSRVKISISLTLRCILIRSIGGNNQFSKTGSLYTVKWNIYHTTLAMRQLCANKSVHKSQCDDG